jgi:hypothetical protein
LLAGERLTIYTSKHLNMQLCCRSIWRKTVKVLFPLLEEHASPMAGYARERGVDFENPALHLLPTPPWSKKLKTFSLRKENRWFPLLTSPS